VKPAGNRLPFALAVALLAWGPLAAPAAAEPTPATPVAPAAKDTAPVTATAAMIAAASAESDRWLDLIDRGLYAESWVAAAAVLQEGIPQKQWTADLALRQPKLGRTIMRERKSESFSNTLRGAPTGAYVVVVYLTKFEKIPLAEETLAVAKDAIGQWHVAGYDIALSPAKTP
jgi:hypothetical protein